MNDTKKLPVPRDRRLPLSRLRFRDATEVPGLTVAVKELSAGCPVVASDREKAPMLFFDPELRCVVIEGRHYPVESVKWFERAKMAKG